MHGARGRKDAGFDGDSIIWSEVFLRKRVHPAQGVSRRDCLRGGECPPRRRGRMESMRYDFLVETYETERIKVVSVWSEFRDEDLPVRPRGGDSRGRSVREQMVHQCASENLWFLDMLGVDVNAPPLPAVEIRVEFMKSYAEASWKRLARQRSAHAFLAACAVPLCA